MYAPIWFSESDYLASKLAQLRATEPDDPRWMQSEITAFQTIRDAITAIGQTPYEHFLNFGSQERTSPNAWFNVEEYLDAKVSQLNKEGYQGRANWTVQQTIDAIYEAGMTIWTHFQLFGWREGVNPSMSFDVSAYFDEKLKQLHQALPDESWDDASMKRAFEDAQLDPITHFLLYGRSEGLAVVPVTPPTPTPKPTPTPAISSITYGRNDGHLAIGEAVTLRLQFNVIVDASVGSSLRLNNGGVATYQGGNGTSTLVFTYSPQIGHTVSDLALADSDALFGSITNTSGTALAAGSLDGLNPAGTVAVDGVQSTVVITAGVGGLRVTSNKPGDVLIQDAGGTQHLVHAGNSTDAVDALIGPLLSGAVTGTVVVRSPSGNLGNEQNNVVVAIGSGAAQNLAGQYVWGHGGDDVIDGTAGADWLFGGDGNDTIRAGAGTDVVYGGRGGDTIDLGVDNDVDRLVYGAGEFDAPQPQFVDGDTTTHIDKVDHLGVGDIIDLGRPFSGAPVLRDTYLSGLDENEYALVRGSSSGGRFMQGDSAADDDFMLQWVTNGVVGSAILQDVGSRVNFAIDRAAGTLTLAAPAPAMSLVSSVSYSSLLGDVVTATFESLPDPVTHTPGSATGLANRNGFSLLNYREFSPLPTDPGHVTAPVFGLQGNVLSLNGPLESNLYSMFWTNDTFDTTAGYLATWQVFFAGGHNNGFDNDGFAVVGMRTMSGNTTITDAVPWAIFGHASGTASLVTGSGNDVVLSKSGALTVVYTGIDAGAEDLILDFNPAKDFIGLAGDLRDAVDDNGNGLNWMVGSGGQLMIGAGVEAVQVTLDGPAAVVSSAPSLQQQTLGTLNGALDVSQLARGDDLLILARHAEHTGSAALAYYRAEDDNGLIDANELTFIATFNGGAPFMGNIQLVGLPAS